MYTLIDYGDMISGNSRVRLETFGHALQQHIRPGDTVLEVGAGPGIFSLLACEAGASKVYSVEVDPSIEHLPVLAEKNGFKDRIEIFCGPLEEFSIPEKVDLIVSDLRGSLPLFLGSIETLIDAKRRFLKAGGAVIPYEDTLFAAVVSSPALYERYIAPWSDVSASIDVSGLQKSALNFPLKTSISKEDCTSDSYELFTINYMSVSSTDFSGQIEIVVEKPATAHGMAVWFDSEIIDGAGYSNAPGEPELVYKQTFFPFLTPIRLEKGNIIRFTLRADYIFHDYVWRWNTKLFNDSTSNEPLLHFEQSDFFAEPLSYERIKSNNPEGTPCISSRGKIEQVILESFTGAHSLEAIAKRIQHEFPDSFENYQEAFEKVALSARRFGQL
jgi:protein arginine N-methyltransferase 1